MPAAAHPARRGLPGIEKSVRPLRLDEVDPASLDRLSTGVPEIDRVLGGGIVAGSATLIAGNPGIGKSTLMTELCRRLAPARVLYVAGEESPGQIKIRADRLGIAGEHLLLLPETHVEAIVSVIMEDPPTAVVIDSIQTLYREDIPSAPGSVAQVRESAASLVHLAKSMGIAVFIVGHVTKDGAIAGPRVLEHMVDTVLYLEGDRHHTYRLLRAVKNRFGSTNEIGVFEMRRTGLAAVENPSRIFLSERNENVSGAVVVCSMEGTRPLLAEIQALVAPTSYPTGQRTATGFDSRRLQMLLAVLEKREGLHLAATDVFINVTGGLRLSEPAIDLGVAAAVVSSFRDAPVDDQTVFLGEVGLSGEIRAVSGLEARVNEAANLGFRDAVVPSHALKEIETGGSIRLHGVDTLHAMLDRFL
jgi:DNA repair protein RadA/Sms